jgi:probable rRNA maturation factor
LIEIECPAELLPAARAALRAASLDEGHVTVALVESERIRALNRDHRGRDEPTDVLAFPVDGRDPTPGPRELGDVVICPEHTTNLEEAAVHGLLHLAGYDHEADEGAMLALQAQVMAELQGA